MVFPPVNQAGRAETARHERSRRGATETRAKLGNCLDPTCIIDGLGYLKSFLSASLFYLGLFG